MSHFNADSMADNWETQETQKSQAKQQTDTAHGSASFASAQEMAGLRAGALLTGRAAGGLLRYGGEGHCLTFAPTGSGKSVAVVVPNLIHYPGSIVCLDPKGAIPAITAARRRAMGQDVVLLDPFSEVENAMEASGKRHLWGALPRATYNPFSQLDPLSRYVVDDVRVMAGSLIVQKNDKNAYFSDSARAILECLILYLLASGGAAALTVDAVLNLAFDSRQNYEKTWLVEMRRCSAFGGKVARLANQIEDFTGEGGAAVWSSLRQNMGLLDTDSLRDVMQSSDLNFSDLKNKRATVYLVLPAQHLHTHGVWLRLMLSVIMRQLSDARGSRYPVLFLVDECATLGRLEILETAVGLMRGYGMKLWLIFQDLPQLKTIYGERWSSFISNSGMRQFFNVNDTATADYVSEYLGKETLYTLSENISVQGQMPGSNIASAGRPLLTPDEVRRLDKDEEILLYERQNPVSATKLCYHEDSEFKDPKTGENLFSDDPYIIGRKN
jgi:type IV secretion system protein VirD4